MPLFRRALMVTLTKVGRAHPDAIAAANNLANCPLQQQQLGDAEEIYRENLNGLRNAYGTKHPLTIQTFSNLATCLEMQGGGGKLQEAEAMYVEAKALLSST